MIRFTWIRDAQDTRILTKVVLGWLHDGYPSLIASTTNANGVYSYWTDETLGYWVRS